MSAGAGPRNSAGAKAPPGAGPQKFAGAKAPPGAGPQNFAGAKAPPGAGPEYLAGAKAPPGAGRPGPQAPANFCMLWLGRCGCGCNMKNHSAYK